MPRPLDINGNRIATGNIVSSDIDDYKVLYKVWYCRKYSYGWVMNKVDEDPGEQFYTIPIDYHGRTGLRLEKKSEV